MKNKKIAFGVIGILALVTLSFFIPYGDVLNNIIVECRALGIYGIMIFIVVYALLCIALAPGSIITMAVGAVYGFGIGYVVVTLGSLLAATLSFLIGKFLFHNAISNWLIKYPRIKLIQNAISKKGLIIVFLMRLSPLFPFAISNYAFSLTDISFKNYFFISWVGMIPGTVLYVYLGVLSTSLIQTDVALQGKTALMVAGLCATVLLSWFIAKIARSALYSQLDTENIS